MQKHTNASCFSVAIVKNHKLIFKKKHFLFAVILVSALGHSCRKSKAPAVSFYYWKTKYALNHMEEQVLQSNKVQQLYVRYFDIEVDKTTHKARPIGVIQFDKSNPVQKIVPVIYIKNEVFETINNIDSLCKNVHQLTTAINNAIHQNPETIQFDCDWTLRTKDAYFHFLKKYKIISKKQVSATIRLHQIKYRLTTGVPPVDFGVLMFYNMGKIDASENNSIFDAKIASAYLEKLDSYPLRLDIALPVFAWGIQIRNGKVIHLLNKMKDAHFKDDTSFQQIKKGFYKANKSCFKGGYYFQQHDEVKIESIATEQLMQIPSMLQKHMQQEIQQIIFYDLDDFNLENYDADIYQKVANRFN